MTSLGMSIPFKNVKVKQKDNHKWSFSKRTKTRGPNKKICGQCGILHVDPV